MTSVNGGVRKDCPFVGRQVDGRYLRIVLKNPPICGRDSGRDEFWSSGVRPSASDGEGGRRKGDELRQFPQILGGGG